MGIQPIGPFINTMKPELFIYELFKGFSTQNVKSRLGGKPLNLCKNKFWVLSFRDGILDNSMAFNELKT
jgi:hypothetical protein